MIWKCGRNRNHGICAENKRKFYKVIPTKSTVFDHLQMVLNFIIIMTWPREGKRDIDTFWDVLAFGN